VARIDLVGQTFGKLTVTARAPSKKGSTRWHCVCECGGTSTPYGARLTGGHAKSCGCAQGTPLIDLTGLVFGRLTVLRRSDEKRGGKFPMWECLCTCGRSTLTKGVHLRNGATKSCGCINGSNKYSSVEEANLVRAYDQYSRGAAARGYEWGLTTQQFGSIVNSPCIYCGAPPEERPSRWKKAPITRSSGIDRVDNNQGYVVGNVVPCCTRCNIMKRDHSMMDFVAHCRAVAARFPEVGL
jgi:hypothetical protein